MNSFMICDEYGLFILGWEDKRLRLIDALEAGQEVANSNDIVVTIWNAEEETWRSDALPTMILKPTKVYAGMSVGVHRNQGFREALVVAVIGDECMVEYWMPNGRSYLFVCPTWALACEMNTDFPMRNYRSISKNAIPKKWREAADEEWV